MPAAIIAVAEVVADAVVTFATVTLPTFVASLGFANGLGAGIAAWSEVAAVAEVLLYKPNLKSAGSFQNFLADPQAAIPFVCGRFGVSGRAIYMTTSGGGDTKLGSAGNEYLSNLVILSANGPIKSLDYFKCNDTIVSLNGAGQVIGGTIAAGTFSMYAASYTLDSEGNAIDNNFNGVMGMTYQLGDVPSPALMPSSALGLSEWTSDHALSGFAAAWWELTYDSKVYGGGQPKPYWVIEGYSVYDPREDSTYPGGSGAQRWGDRTTWGYSQNPFIHALNFALGFWLPDPTTGDPVLYAGIGQPASAVDFASLVAAANVADANGWIIGGGWTSDDDKYAVYSNMLAAGSGMPVIGGGVIGCIVNTPQTSIGDITVDLLAGPVSVETSASIRDRINRVFPRYHSEPHNWSLVLPLAPVTGETYVAEDQGRVRSKTIDYQFCTQVNQACQLGAYDVANSREGVVVTLHGKPALGTYPAGCCVTLDIPDAGLDSFKGIVTKRSIDLMTGMVTMTVRSETDAKHAWALGISGVAPASPQISGASLSIVAAPVPDSWAAGALLVQDPVSGVSNYVVQVNGSSIDNVYASELIVQARQALTFDGGGDPLTYGPWVNQLFPATATTFNLNLNPGVWDVAIRYRTGTGAEDTTQYLDLGNITVPGPPGVLAPGVGSWSVNGSTVGGETGTAPILTVTGAVDQPGVQAVIVDYRRIIDLTPTYGPWVRYQSPASATTIAINVGAVGDYQVHVRYQSVAGVENAAIYLDLGSIEVDAPQTNPLPNVTGLTTSYVGGILRLSWNAVSDYRNPDYEIRRGASWASSPPIARMAATTSPSLGDGQYWIAAHYTLPNGGGDVYSPAPATITLAGSQLTSNVIVTHDEAATGWSGTLTNLQAAAGDLLPSTGQLSGTYQVPVAHRVAVGRVAACNVIMTLSAVGQASDADIITTPDILSVADLLGGDLGSFISATPQVRTSQDGGVTWSAWSDWSPSAYLASNFDFQVILATTNASVIPYLTAFTVAVDVPDLVQSFTNQAIASGGSTLTFASPFNGGPGAAAIPNVQVTILNASAGDTVVYSATLTTVTVKVLNAAGTGVARNVNIIAQGY